MSVRNQIMGAAGFSSVIPNYIEDVFSPYLYTATGSAQTITNGIDLATKGGLVWVKSRTNTDVHTLQDTVRGTSSVLVSNGTYASLGFTTNITSFNSNGFSIGTGSGTSSSGQQYAAWTFRNQAKFFRCGTYTGNGAASQTIAHALGAVPGCIMVKNITTGGTNWFVYHKYAFDTAGTYGAQGYMNLNLIGSSNYVGTDLWTPTTTTFQANGSSLGLNNSGDSYAYYLFAHNAGGFGLTGTDNVISCGSFVTNASGGASVTLGYEPQWILLRRSDDVSNWQVIDNMRGWSQTAGMRVMANTSDSESDGWANYLPPTATGFNMVNGATGPSENWIYITIRRGPMKVPTDATKVFSPALYTGNGSSNTVTSPFPTDLLLVPNRAGNYFSPSSWDRLRGATNFLRTTGADAEAVSSDGLTSFGASQNAVAVGADATYGNINFSGRDYIPYSFRRAPGFFDEVCYTGTGVARTVTHNLGVAPEMYIIKNRGTATNWVIYSANFSTPNDQNLYFTTAGVSTNANIWSTPTSTTFGIGTGFQSSAALNANGSNYVAYLFATCPGVSKVGSYTGTGTTLQINCGFSAGARFVLIKRTDTTGDWYLWDTARGIVAGNDPYLLLNSTAAEATSTDYIDPYSAGFELSSTAPAAINASGGSFIYLAIA